MRGIRRRDAVRSAGLIGLQALLSSCDFLLTPEAAKPPAPPPASGTAAAGSASASAAATQSSASGTASGPTPPTSVVGQAQPSPIPTGLPSLRLPQTGALSNLLRAGHPRLALLPAQVTALQQALTAYPALRQYHQAVVWGGEALLKEPPVKPALVKGRLLQSSQEILERLYILGLLFRLDGNARWVRRAAAELEVAGQLNDWNPGHFLDTAEMMHGVAIGYDWLHEGLTPAERQAVEAALLDKGLKAARAEYDRPAWWVATTHHWNIVGNVGVALAALAVGDSDPSQTNELFHLALSKLPPALLSYAPDGGWFEGPSYWRYTTGRLVTLIEALRNAVGTDFGISDAPGLAKTGRFRLYVTGPTRRAFNFAETNDQITNEPTMSWLARRYDDPVLAWSARDAATSTAGNVRDLLWFDARGSAQDLDGLPREARFQGIGLAVLRSSWSNPDALYVALKGGDNSLPFQHLDLGTFILEGFGQRWIVDLGSDDIDLPGYFEAPQRWRYYRTSTAGHNTLTIGGQNQDTRASANVTTFRSTNTVAAAVVDLSRAYANQGLTIAQRGVALVDGRRLVIMQDELTANRPVEVVWTVHTPASLVLSGAAALLELAGKQLAIQVHEPAGAVFASAPVTLAPPQLPATSISRLTVTVPVAAPGTRLVVSVGPPTTLPPKVVVLPLDRWATAGPSSVDR